MDTRATPSQEQRILLVSIINQTAASHTGRAPNTSAIVRPVLIALLWEHHVGCHPSTPRQLTPLRRLQKLLRKQNMVTSSGETLKYVYMHVKLWCLIRGCEETHAEWNGTEREEEEET
jgi:hypothetical protein